MNEAKKMRYEIALPYVQAFLEKFGKWTGVVTEGLHFTINTDKIEVLKPDPTVVINSMVNAGTTSNERREALNYDPINDQLAAQVTYSMNTAFIGDDAALSQPLPENEPDNPQQQQ